MGADSLQGSLPQRAGAHDNRVCSPQCPVGLLEVSSFCICGWRRPHSYTLHRPRIFSGLTPGSNSSWQPEGWMPYESLARVVTPAFSSTEINCGTASGKLPYCPGHPQTSGPSPTLQIILVYLYAWLEAWLHINLPVLLVSIKGELCRREGCIHLACYP